MGRPVNRRRFIAFTLLGILVLLTPALVVWLLARPIYEAAADLPRQIAAAKAESVPLTYSELDPKLGEREDAYPLYLKARKLSPKFDFDAQSNSEKSLPSLRAYLKTYAPAMALVESAAAKPKCFLPLEDGRAGSPMLVGDLRHWAGIALFQERLCTAENNFAGAVKAFRLATAITGHLAQQPDVFADGMVRSIWRLMRVEMLRTIAGSKEDEKVIATIAAIAGAPTKPLTELVRGAAATSWGRLDEIVDTGFSSSPPVDGSDLEFRSYVRGNFPFYAKRATEVDAYRAQIKKVDRELVAIARAASTEGEAATKMDAFIERVDGGQAIMSINSLVHPTWTAVIEGRDRDELQQHLFRALLEVVRHRKATGILPQHLESSDDKITTALAEKQVIYRNQGDRVQLYYVGSNGIDNGLTADDLGFTYPPIPKKGVI